MFVNRPKYIRVPVKGPTTCGHWFLTCSFALTYSKSLFCLCYTLLKCYFVRAKRVKYFFFRPRTIYTFSCILLKSVPIACNSCWLPSGKSIRTGYTSWEWDGSVASEGGDEQIKQIFVTIIRTVTFRDCNRINKINCDWRRTKRKEREGSFKEWWVGRGWYWASCHLCRGVLCGSLLEGAVEGLLGIGSCSWVDVGAGSMSIQLETLTFLLDFISIEIHHSCFYCPLPKNRSPCGRCALSRAAARGAVGAENTRALFCPSGVYWLWDTA